MSTTDSDRTDRLHGLDALRGGALLLGVVLHAAMAYLTVPVWPTGDVAAEPVADGLGLKQLPEPATPGEEDSATSADQQKNDRRTS